MKRSAPGVALQEATGLLVAGRLEEAYRACRKLIQARPDLAEAHLLLGELYEQRCDGRRASESFGRALRLRPEWNAARAYAILGDLFGDAGRYAAAESRYRKALSVDPGMADARFNLAAALAALGRLEECIAELTALLAAEPHASDARQRLVLLLHQSRRLDELEAVCREGTELHPRDPFYRCRLGVALWWRGQSEAALAAYRFAAELAATGSAAFLDAKGLEASSLLSLGRYEEGWLAYRWRSTRKSLRDAQPRIIEDPSGIASLEGPARIGIVSEQGLGDELFFLRFAEHLRDRGHRLTAVCAPRLVPVLSELRRVFEGGVRAAPATGDDDYLLAAGDLPLACGESFALPLALPVDAERRAAFEARLRAFGPPPYVGVSWRAGLLPDDPRPQHGVHWVKEVSPEALAAILRPLDARLVVLQRRPAAQEVGRFCEVLGRPALDLSAVNDDLQDALAVLSILDDYVGVSNTNMHLRAAVPGKPARVLVRQPAEWRWGVAGGESPWFPGFKVYRQEQGADWRPLLDQLRSDLLRH